METVEPGQLRGDMGVYMLVISCPGARSKGATTILLRNELSSFDNVDLRGFPMLVAAHPR